MISREPRAASRLQHHPAPLVGPQRFGPVRVVKAENVFELGFEAVNASRRHKSGVAVRFPRILRWREDKRVADADRIEALRALAR